MREELLNMRERLDNYEVSKDLARKQFEATKDPADHLEYDIALKRWVDYHCKYDEAVKSYTRMHEE